jgi:Putative amidase domain
MRAASATWSDGNVLRGSGGGASNNASLGFPFQRITNDCAQFVSTVLHLGGNIPINDSWYSKVYQSANWSRGQTNSWTYSQDFRNYWLGTGQMQEITLSPTANYANIAKPGDVLLADFQGDLVWDHVAIFTNTNFGSWSYYDPHNGGGYAGTGADIINQHNVDRRQAPWNIGYRNGSNPNIVYRLLHWIGYVG